MKNQLNYQIPDSWAGRTVESFLRNQLQLSRSQVRLLKKNNGILLNSQPVRVTTYLSGGEKLKLLIEIARQEIVPEEIPLKIIYEDADLVVINKPSGMIIHPVGVYKGGSLANALVYHWQVHQETASFHPVHRLDRLTSGLVLIAKNPWAHQQLAQGFDSKNFHRIYLAICQGSPLRQSGKIATGLKLAGKGFRWEVSMEGKPAITRYRVLEYDKKFSCLALKLFTGRTHQIRVHLAHIGSPIIGDPLYNEADSVTPRSPLTLHAARLHFIHPRSHQKMKFTVTLPDYFQAILATGIYIC